MSAILIAIAAGTITPLVFFGIRAVVGRWRDPESLEAKLQDAEARARQAERHLEIEKDNYNAAHELRRQAEAERDRALEIAKSHEVTYPEVKKVHTQMVTAWEKRQFNHTPEKNLQAIKDELQREFGDQRLLIRLSLEAQGGWVAVFGKHWKGKPIFLTFEGPAHRVAQEMWAFFNDLDHGFVAKSQYAANYGMKCWVDGDSPMTFKVTVQHEEVVDDPDAERPKIHTVEVAVVRTEVVEHEKLVIPEPETLDGLRIKEQMAHEDLVALIDAVLETRETERGKPSTTRSQEIDREAENLAKKLEAQRRQRTVG